MQIKLIYLMKISVVKNLKILAEIEHLIKFFCKTYRIAISLLTFSQGKVSQNDNLYFMSACYSLKVYIETKQIKFYALKRQEVKK